MFFKKKEVDNQYLLLRQQVMVEYENLTNGSIVANPVEIRNRWQNEYELAKQWHKLSKKYNNTEQDIELSKQYKSNAEKNYNNALYNAELFEYRNKIIIVKSEYEQCDNDMFQVENYEIGKTVYWYDKWKTLYEASKMLFDSKKRYLASGIDENAIDTCYLGSRYYYAFFKLRLVNVQVYDDVSTETYRKKQCLEECIKLIEKYCGNIKFSLLCGHAQFLLGQLQYDIGQIAGYEVNTILANADNEKRRATHNLNKLELNIEDYVMSISFSLAEWHIYCKAVFDLALYYIYDLKNNKKAHDLIEKQLNINIQFIDFGVNRPKFVEQLNEFLSHFQKGILGWKYVE